MIYFVVSCARPCKKYGLVRDPPSYGETIRLDTPGLLTSHIAPFPVLLLRIVSCVICTDIPRLESRANLRLTGGPFTLCLHLRHYDVTRKCRAACYRIPENGGQANARFACEIWNSRATPGQWTAARIKRTTRIKRIPESPRVEIRKSIFILMMFVSTFVSFICKF